MKFVPLSEIQDEQQGAEGGFKFVPLAAPDMSAVPMGTSGVSMGEAEEEPTRAAPKGKSIFERGVKLEPPTVDYEKNLETMRRSGSPESIMFRPGRQLEAVNKQIEGYKNKQAAAAEKAAAMAAQRRANLEQQAEEQGYGPLDLAQDIGVGLAGKGVLSAAQMVAGTGELGLGWMSEDETVNPLQLGNWGKMLNKLEQQFGLTFDAGNKFLTGYQSPQMQLQLGNVEAEKGFVNTAVALGVNPLALTDSILTSLPSMLLGGQAAGAVVRMWESKAVKEAAELGLRGPAAQKFVTDKIQNVARFAAGAAEGGQTAASLADQARAAGVDWEDYVMPALAAGVGTALIGAGSSKLGAKLGLGDIETDIAMRMSGVKGVNAGVGKPDQGVARYVFGELLKEGLLEEMPQSAQEQIWTNLATGRPWNEGVPEASAQGLMVGAGMGGGHALASRALQRAGEVIENKTTEYANLIARKGMPMTAEELARSKGFLKTKKTADELAADLDKIGDEESQQRQEAPQKTADQLAVEEEMRREEEARNAPPVEETTYEGPEVPEDTFTFKPLDKAPAETDEQRADRLAAEDAKQEADREARNTNARNVAKSNFDTAIDQANSTDYNGDVNAALDAYRQNMYDTLNEQGEEDRYAYDAADREFDRLVAEHKAKQAPTPAATSTASTALIPSETPLYSWLQGINPTLDKFYGALVSTPRNELSESQKHNRDILDGANAILQFVSERLANWGHPALTGETRAQRAAAKSQASAEDKELLAVQSQIAGSAVRAANQMLALENGYKGKKAGSQEKVDAAVEQIKEDVVRALELMRARGLISENESVPTALVAQPTTLQLTDESSTAAQKTIPELEQEIAQLKGQRNKLLTPTGKEPKPTSKNGQKWAVLTRQMDDLWGQISALESGRVQAPAQAQLTNEPYTIEGETRVIDETVKPQLETLSPLEIQKLQSHYGLRYGSEQFLVRVKEDIVRYANRGAAAVSSAIRDIIQKLHAGVLAAAMIFNPTNVSIPEFLVVPKMTVTETRQVFAELPAGVERMSESGKEAYRTLYPAIKERVQKDNKLFIIADKPTSHTYIFKPDGTLLIRTKTLFGKAYGDFYKGNNTLPQNRITPAGFFTFGLRDALRSAGEEVTAGEYDYKKVFVLDKVISGEYSMTLFHSVWLNDSDAAMRARAIASEDETDSRYSFGCINVNKQTYGYLVNNHLHQMDGSSVFIVPDNPANLATLLSGNPENRDGLERNTFTPPTETVVHESDTNGVSAEQTAQLEADRRRTIFKSIVETATNSATNVGPELADLVKANMAGVNRIVQLYRDGKLSPEDFAAQMLRLQERIETQTETKRNVTNQRMRGFGRVVKALEDAKKAGRISPETADFAIWFLTKNPALASSLGIKIALPENKKVQAEMEGTAGFYVPFEELVRIITRKDPKTGQYYATKTDTAVHEILHHIERMLPDNIRRAIRKEWAKQIKNEMARARAESNADKIKYLEYVLFANATGSSAAYKAAEEMLTSGSVPMSLYKLFNPSEFWAVRGSDMLAGRYGANTMFAKAKQWFREFIQAVKSLFGFENDHPIIRGLESALRGDGTFVSEDLLREGVYDVPPRQVTAKGLHPEVVAAIERNDITGALRAIARNTSGLYSVLAARLAELNLPTNIGFNKERDMIRQIIDNKCAPAQAQLFTYIRRAYPEVYNKYFSAYDKPESLEKVYAGLKVLEQSKYDTTPLQLQLEAVRQSFDDAMPGLTRSGMYAPSLDSISLNTKGPFGLKNRVVLHEIVHAATEYMLRNTRKGILSDRQFEAVTDLYTMFEYAKLNFGTKDYGFTDIYEFVAEALTNPDFQAKLRTLPYKAVKSSVLNGFIRYILNLFGVRNVASAAMVQANEIFSAERSEGMVHSGLRFAPVKGKKGRYKAGPLTSKWRTAEDYAMRVGDVLRKAMTSIPDAKQLAEIMRRAGVYRARMAELPFLGVRMIKDEVSRSIPHIGTVVDIVTDLSAYRGRMITRAKAMADKWAEMQLDRPEQSRLMGRIMLEATIQGTEVDPKGPGYVDPQKAQPGEKVAHPNLEAAWEGLDDDFQQLYREVRDYYTSLLKATIHEMKRRVAISDKPLAEKKRLLREIDRQFNPAGFNKPYFPLRRFGDYWFQVTSNGRSEFYTFESFAARDLAYDQRYKELMQGNALQKEAAANMKSGNSISQIYSDNKDTAGALKDVNELIDAISSTVTTTHAGQQITVDKTADEVKAEVKDAVNQLVYILLPQQSMKKMFINRRAVQGASSDMLRVFAETATRAAYQQSRFKYVQPFLNNMVNARDYVGKYIRGKRQTVALDYINEIENRYKNIFGLEDKSGFAKFAGGANQAMFVYNLSAPASALMNVIAFPIMAERTIGAKYGVAKANKVIAQYFGRYMATVPTRTIMPIAGGKQARVQWPSIVEGSPLKGASARAAKKFADDGDIMVSQTSDIFGFADRPSSAYASAAQSTPVNTVTGALYDAGKYAVYATAETFHQLDRLTREVTLMSVFDLAYEKYLGAEKRDARGVIERDPNGTPLVYTEQEAFDKAIEEARDAAASALGEYLRQLKGRAFAHPVGALALQMKQVSMTIAYAIFRDMWLAFGAPFTKAEKQEFKTFLEDHYKNAPNRDALIARDLKEFETSQKEVYREAFRKVVLLNVTAMLMAGAEGTPLYFLVSIIPALARMFAPDGDEWMDFETWFYNMLMRDFSGAATALAVMGGMGEEKAERFGEKAAHAVARGIPSAVTNWSLTERIGVNPSDLLFRDSKFYTDNKQALQEMISNQLGPLASFLLNTAPDIVQLMYQGHYERGFEKLLPAGLSKPMVATRLATEGAKRVSGKTVLHDEYFDKLDIAAQAIGIRPENLAVTERAASQADEMKLRLNHKKTALLDRIWVEHMYGREGENLARRDFYAFASRHPDLVPDPEKTIEESFESKLQGLADAAVNHGVAIPENVLQEVAPILYGAKKYVK